MSDDYLWDRKGAPDPDVERLEQLLAPLAHDRPLAHRRSRRAWWIAGGALVAAAAAIAIVVALPRHDGPPVVVAPAETGFDFIARDGTVLVNQRAVSVGTLAAGDTLDTRSSRVELLIADIGRAELDPATRVRLERSDARTRHLAIDHGRLHARVSAPPRLFVLTTPRAQVTDLGCEYTIEVAADGNGRISVLSGKVELATKSGAIVVAPAGTHAQLVAGALPGLPIADGAPAELEDAAAHYLAGSPADALLAIATPRDAITIIALAAADAGARRAALARLAELSPPPAGVTIDGAASDAAQLARWRDAIIAPASPGKSKKSP